MTPIKYAFSVLILSRRFIELQYNRLSLSFQEMTLLEFSQITENYKSTFQTVDPKSEKVGLCLTLDMDFV